MLFAKFGLNGGKFHLYLIRQVSRLPLFPRIKWFNPEEAFIAVIYSN